MMMIHTISLNYSVYVVGLLVLWVIEERNVYDWVSVLFLKSGIDLQYINYLILKM